MTASQPARISIRTARPSGAVLIERQALLTPVQTLEEEAAGTRITRLQPRQPEGSPRIAHMRPFLHLDDLDNHVGQELRPEGVGAVVFNGQDSKGFQHGVAFFNSIIKMTSAHA